jgi:AcrR family transcriptional regulator
MPSVDHEQRQREMIAALESLAADEGPDISVAKFCRRCGYSNTHIYYYFENWADLRTQAGLPPRVNRSRIHAVHSRESLLALLHKLAGRIGEDITLREFVHHTGISTQPIERVFGGWRAFKAAAGLGKHRKPGLPLQHTAASVRQRIEQLLAESEGSLTLHDFIEQTGISGEVIHRHGGWSRLRQELGYLPRGQRPWLAADDSLRSVLEQLFPAEHFLPWLNEPDPFLEAGAGESGRV